MDGNLLDDIYSLDPATGVWSILYKSDNAWQKNGHALTCLIGKKLVIASAKSADPEKPSKYEDIRILEFGKIAEQHMLTKDMEKRIAKELKGLEAFNKEAIANLSRDPTKEADAEKQREVLLKVKGCIYQAIFIFFSNFWRCRFVFKTDQIHRSRSINRKLSCNWTC